MKKQKYDLEENLELHLIQNRCLNFVFYSMLDPPECGSNVLNIEYWNLEFVIWCLEFIKI